MVVRVGPAAVIVKVVTDTPGVTTTVVVVGAVSDGGAGPLSASIH